MQEWAKVAESATTVLEALRPLACFTRNEPEACGTALTRKLTLPRTNVLRLLASLERGRLVERTGRGHWRLGVRALELGSLYLATNPLPLATARALEALAARTDCKTYLGVLEGEDAVILMRREGSLPVRFVFQAGSRLPATTTALGKAMLAHLPAAELAARYGSKALRQLTRKSLSGYDDLVADLARARKRGWHSGARKATPASPRRGRRFSMAVAGPSPGSASLISTIRRI